MGSKVRKRKSLCVIIYKLTPAATIYALRRERNARLANYGFQSLAFDVLLGNFGSLLWPCFELKVPTSVGCFAPCDAFSLVFLISCILYI